MWIVTHINSGIKMYLLSGRGYTVGRVGSDIVLTDDTSISRSHAMFHVSDDSIKLEDKGSKYGTYHNEHIENKLKLPKGKQIDLKQGDRIMFGALKNEWLVSKNNINTIVSSLTAEELVEVKNQLDILGGNIISKWEPICTHLTMSEITITIKVLHALIEKIPIVSCGFWKVYLKNVHEKKKLPTASHYFPKRSSLLSSAIQDEHLSFNENRKTLFSGKTFVFMSKKHYDTYSPIIIRAGGQCKDLKNNVSKSFLIKKNVIVVQYVASTQSQGSQTINTISEYLESHSLRTIPEYEIGLAIVCCTIEKYCNPLYSAISNILPDSAFGSPNIGTLLAENTRSQKTEDSAYSFPCSDVPESNDLQNKEAPNKPLQSEVYDSEIIIINNSSRSSNAIECHSINPETSTLRKNKKTSVETEEKEIENSKSINFSDDDFSENLIVYSDMSLNEVIDSKQCDQTNEKRKRSITPIKTGIISNKKAKISTPVVANDYQKQTDNQEEEPGPSVSISKRNVPLRRQILPGFLQKSQILNTQPQAQDVIIGKQIEKRADPLKRSRIALITGSDSDDADIFNFGSSPKKTKASECISDDDELFAFENKASRDDVDDAEYNEQENISNTPIFNTNKKSPVNFTSCKIKVSPIKAVPDGWLSSLSILKIKSDDEIKDEKDCSADEINQKKWIASLKEGFEVRVRKMNLSSKGSNRSFFQDSSSTSLNTSKKNFKAFVKKHNYKAQTQIIPTVPTVVPPIK